TARTKQGELQTGFVESPSQEMAANILNGHDLFVLSVKSAERKNFFEGAFSFFNRVKIVYLMTFTRQFATLLQSTVPLNDSLVTLHKQTKNPVLKEAIFEISNDVSAGLSLSQALERQSGIFSDFYINMVRSAEITGRMEEVMGFLADYLEKEAVWRSRVRNALIYPAFVLSLFAIVGVFLLTFVFPKLTIVFEETSVKLPLMTKIFLEAGNFLLNWWWAIAIIAVLLITLLIDYLRTGEGKAVLSEIMIKLPVLGDLFKKMHVARFSESLGVLIKGGIPITQAIEVTAHVIGNVIYRDILDEIAEKVKAGELLSNLLRQNEYYFPDLVGQMVAIGENTGRLEQMLEKISDFYSREVENTLDNLTELIQPVLISIIGIFVGLLFASVLIPIYNLTQSFNR
ncbi:MAG: type II secretion system F family protein, partial [Patescibacteria group bacterium]